MDDELIQYLLSIGALEFIIKDEESGESLYRLTSEAKELVPTLYEEHIKKFNSTVFSLWNKDMIDLVFDDEGEPMVRVNDNSYDKKKVSILEEFEKNVLAEIIFLWDKKQEE